jgi:GNAT superfamily N-acetyltransferase
MSLVVRPMRESDFVAAQDVHRLAFARFFGMDPAKFRPGNRTIAMRASAYPENALVAEQGGVLVGSAIALSWGRVAIVGPISVHPDRWSGGIGRALMTEVMARIDARSFDHSVLFTHPQSPRHLRLYETFGFWSRELTALMSRGVDTAHGSAVGGYCIDGEQCRAIAAANFPGLDLTREIEALAVRKLGALVAVDGGFAICHFGPGSEAREGTIYVKFAAVRPGDARGFAALLDAVEAHAISVGAQRVALGVNCARRGAYHALQARGYRVDSYGVNMHRPDSAGWDLPDRYAVCDLK